MERKDIHDKAWDLLTEKGLSLGAKMRVRSSFIEWSGYKNEYPFIKPIYVDGEISYYMSEYEEIKTLCFKTNEEVILANAIFLNIKDKNNNNDFINVFKFTCKLIGVDTEWNK